MANEFIARNGITSLGNIVVSGSISSTGAITISGSIASSSFAATASSADNFLTRGTLTAQTIVVQTITSSIDWVTGSAKFGSINSNTHTFTGSVAISGSATTALDVNAGALFVSSSGRVGIGIITPNFPLQVNSSTTISRIQLTNTSTGTTSGDGFQVIADGVNATLSLPETGYMSFETSNTERMRITSGGNVLIGTTSDGSGKLQVSGSNSSIIAQIKSPSGMLQLYPFFSAYSGPIIQALDGAGSSTVPLRIECSTVTVTGAATFSSSVTTNGTITLGSNSSGTPFSLGTSTARFQLMNGGVYGLAGDVLTNGNTYLQSQRTDGNTSVYNLLLQPLGGNVGIGTTSPTANLEIYDNTNSGILRLSRDAGQQRGALQYGRNNSGTFQLTGQIVCDSDTTSVNNGVMTFWTSNSSGTNTERMRITSGGNVGIGTTSIGNKLTIGGVNSDQLKLQTDSDPTGYNTVIQSAYNYAESFSIKVKGGGASTSTIMSWGDTAGLSFPGAGNMTLNSTVYNYTTSATVRTLYIGGNYTIGGVSSTRASKKNIEDISNVDWLYNLNPVTFNYRKKDAEGNYTEEVYEDINYGLIAEDTAPIADFLINYNEKKDGTKEIAGIEYPRLITPLVKAIQELKTQNDSLQSQINELKAQ